MRLLTLATLALVMLPISAGALGSQSRRHAPAPMPAMRAYDFYSKFGVNGNLDSRGSVAAELADMDYLGIKNIRSSMYNASAVEANNWGAALALLSAAGVRQHIDIQAGGGEPFNDMFDWIAALKHYIVEPYGARMVTGVSGPNEMDLGQYFGYKGLTGVPAANAAQADLYTAIKADPALSAIAVDMWPLGGLYGSFTTGTVGDQTAHCDRANLHDYYSPDNYNQPTYPTVGSMQVSLQQYLRNARLVCNRPSFVTTETGWYTPIAAGWEGAGANEYVQARLLLNDLFDHAMLPANKFVYIFTLRWGSADFSDPGYGVIHDDGTPKISGTAIHNLMAILHDPSAGAATFAPSPVKYSLAGMPAASGSFAIQKSTGAFDIILWNETPIWANSTATQISIPTNLVTVSLPSRSSVAVYDPVHGAAPIKTGRGVDKLQVSLNDAPLIIEVSH